MNRPIVTGQVGKFPTHCLVNLWWGVPKSGTHPTWVAGDGAGLDWFE